MVTERVLNPNYVVIALVVILALVLVVNHFDEDGDSVCPNMVEGTICQAFYQAAPTATQPPSKPTASGNPSTITAAPPGP